jgi:hypothetical protein
MMLPFPKGHGPCREWVRTNHTIRPVLRLQTVKNRQHKQGKHILATITASFTTGKPVKYIIEIRHEIQHFQIDFLGQPMPKRGGTRHKIYRDDFCLRLLAYKLLRHRFCGLDMSGTDGRCQY